MILSRHKIETVSPHIEIKLILDHVFDIFIKKKKKLDTNIFNFDFLVVIFIFLVSTLLQEITLGITGFD